MNEFKGTKGSWQSCRERMKKPLTHQTVCKIYASNGINIIATIPKCNDEKNRANANLISKAPDMLTAMNDLIIELDKLNKFLPKENEEHGNLIWDRIQTCRSLVKNVLK